MLIGGRCYTHVSGRKPVSQSASPTPSSPSGKVMFQARKDSQWEASSSRAEKVSTADDNQTQTEDTPTERRRIIGQTQQQEEDTGRRPGAQEMQLLFQSLGF